MTNERPMFSFVTCLNSCGRSRRGGVCPSRYLIYSRSARPLRLLADAFQPGSDAFFKIKFCNSLYPLPIHTSRISGPAGGLLCLSLEGQPLPDFSLSAQIQPSSDTLRHDHVLD